MSIEVTPLVLLQSREEADGAFAQDVSGSAFIDLPIREGTEQLNLSPNPLDTETAQQRIDGYGSVIAGPKFAELTFGMNIGCSGAPAGDGQQSIARDDSPLTHLLGIGMGGCDDQNAGTDVDSGTSATEFSVTSAAGFAKGGAFARVRDSDGRLEAREVAGVSGTDITSRLALSDTPSANDVIYAATTCYPTENPLTSFQMKRWGTELQDRWHLLGGQLTALAFSTETGAIPTITPSFRFANWQPAEDASSRFDSGILPLGSYGDFWELAFMDSEVLAVPVADSTRTLLHAPQLAIQSQLAYVPAPSVSGVNTVLRMRRNRVAPTFALTFSTYLEDYAWVNAARNRAYYYLQIQIGSDPQRGCILLTFPRAQVVSAIPNDTAGLRTQEVTVRCTNDTDDTSELTRAVSRVHVF